ncbi:MAG: hypothetical protein IAE78_08345 [Myxococcus sp.]|nr:hypothetical protein [Myxococcus sp.]
MTPLLLVMVSLNQAPTPECVSTTNGRVCGYHCQSANGITAKCAETSSGVCVQHVGKVTCFDPPRWLPLALGGAPPAPSCVTDGSAIACGYNCKVSQGRVGCAQTPAGACLAGPDNQVVCADPPPEVYGVFGTKTPPVGCKQNARSVVCGYGCVDAGGALACTRTPFGVCDLREEKPVCFDPDKFVICAGGAQTKKPTCTQHAGRLECGYRCATVGSAIACARTPQGTCDDHDAEKPVCFDPPVRGGSASCLRVIGAE